MKLWGPVAPTPRHSYPWLQILGVVVRVYNLNTLGVEAGGWEVRGYVLVHWEF